jgi:hypothetical protein
MLLGDPLYFECPICSCVTIKGSILSGNTFGSTLYSDGKRIAPMLPEFPYLTKCKNCDHFYWLNDKTEIRQEEASEGMPQYSAEFLNINEYFEALEKISELDTIHERYIRFQIYWTFHDRVRNNNKLFNNLEEEVLYVGNICKLLEIMQDKHIEDLFSKAEMYRNIGLFDETIAVLDKITNEQKKDYRHIYDSIKEAAIKQNREIFKL